jgi:hypothetical protein
VDSWFSSDDSFEFVHYELRKYFVAAIKDNRLAALSMEDKLAGKFHRVTGLGKPSLFGSRGWTSQRS